MADKYLYQNAGTLTEREATVTSAGAGNAGDVVALDGSGRLDDSLMPVGIGADTASIEASETLAAGDFVNVWDSSGPMVRKADASAAGKPADGFVLASVTSGQQAVVYFEGTNTQVSGLTAGAVFLSASSAGQATGTAPSTSGQVVQRLGVAIDSTAINFEPQSPIVLA